MRVEEGSARYGSLLICMHWVMLVLVLAVYACIELRELYPEGSVIRQGLKSWRYMPGFSILALVLPRPELLVE